MHNAIAHHLEPDTHPIPKPQSLFPHPHPCLNSFPYYILGINSYGIEYPLG